MLLVPLVETLVLLAALVSSLGGNLMSPAAGHGIVQGELLYPACTGLPEDLQVCAENRDTGERICTHQFFGRAGYRYRIEVPAGRYEVFAQTESARPGYRAYYSEAVRCGLRVSCTAHDPITVVVESGRTNNAISPADWFGSDDTKGELAWNR